MEDGLAGVGLAVEHEAGARFFEAEFFRDDLCAVEHLAHYAKAEVMRQENKV